MDHPSVSLSQIKRAKFSGTASADLVALVATRKIRVLAFYFTTITATTVKFRSGGATDISPPFSSGANGQIQGQWCPVGWFETLAGEKLDIVLGGAVQTDGTIVYQEV